MDIAHVEIEKWSKELSIAQEFMGQIIYLILIINSIAIYNYIFNQSL